MSKQIGSSINVNTKVLPVIICKDCKNEYFKSLVKIKVISPVLIGSTLKTYAMEQYFECTKCKAIISISTNDERGIEEIPFNGRKNFE